MLLKVYNHNDAIIFNIALEINSMPIAITIKPTSLETALIPDAPKNLTMYLLHASIK